MLSMDGRAHASRGFSVVELVIALSIGGLLLLAGLPSFQTWLQNAQIRNAAESIQNGIQRARIEAVRSNQNVRFTLVSLGDARRMDASCAASSAGRSWVVSLDAPDGECGDAPSATAAPRIIETHAAGDGHLGAVVEARAADGTAASSLVFNGFGRLAGASPIATVALSGTGDDHRALRIVVSSAGAVRLCDPAVEADDLRSCPE